MKVQLPEQNGRYGLLARRKTVTSGPSSRITVRNKNKVGLLDGVPTFFDSEEILYTMAKFVYDKTIELMMSGGSLCMNQERIIWKQS